ncbi:MAG: hypothetical protein KGO96_06830 [Elusimicrobia bacterium]|nr:hypothetical protein [Elusimicrobiota bacterium]
MAKCSDELCGLGDMLCAVCETEIKLRNQTIDEVIEIIQGFRNKNWRRGRMLLNGGHDRDDAIMDEILKLKIKKG